MDDLARLHTELEAAEAAVAEAQAAHRRLATVRDLQDGTAELLVEARAALVDERQDVAALESFSPTRIWAALRGTHRTDLEREQAEVRAGEHAVAVLEARLHTLDADEAGLQARAALLPAATERRDLALSAKGAALIAAGGPVAAELVGLAAEAGATRAELMEVREACDAATAAGEALRAALGMLDGAADWADVDTFLGGGLLTDAMKYDRMDRADRLLRHADAAFARLARELGDLGRAGVAGTQVAMLAQTFDVWFDNIFSDWSVRQRIGEAHGRAHRALQQVAAVHRALSDRRTALDETLAALQDRREQLLRG